jgi:SAM-dependent methyltransferase
MIVKREVDWETRQADHYNHLAGQYEAHYSDTSSQRYRSRFINGPMLEGIDLSERHVLEAMCGSGQTTGYLVERGARVTGLDISTELISSFEKRWPRCEAVCASVLKTPFGSGSLDCVVIVGGLHHLHPRVAEAVDEIHRILKPGGYFCFMEPHAGSLPDTLRKLWYRCDPLFEENEAAVDLASLERRNATRFTFVRTRYLGSFAYLLVLNSLVFRLPLWLKRLYAPTLMAFESALSPLLGRRMACFVVAQWRKQGHSVA